MSSASVVASADLRVCVKVPRATRRRISRISAKGAGSGEPVVRVLETAVAEETRAVGAPDDDVAGVTVDGAWVRQSIEASLENVVPAGGSGAEPSAS